MNFLVNIDYFIWLSLIVLRNIDKSYIVVMIEDIEKVKERLKLFLKCGFLKFF